MDPLLMVKIEVSKASTQVHNLTSKLGLISSLNTEEDRASLVEDTAKIISSFTNIITLLNQNVSAASSPSPLSSSPATAQICHDPDSAVTGASECSQSDDEPAAKKRKPTTKWTVTKKAASDEALPDDGHSWRKYGQKDILGSRHPKSYYRCTHKRESGCPAIKYVQRSDSDPTTFQITYRGEHTCQRSDNGYKHAPQFQLNTACLRINSEGGLELGHTGLTIPKISPKLSPPQFPVYKQELSEVSEVVAEHTPMLFDLGFILDNPDEPDPSCFDLCFPYEQAVASESFCL